jgi:hypothetical protein
MIGVVRAASAASNAKDAEDTAIRAIRPMGAKRRSEHGVNQKTMRGYQMFSRLLSFNHLYISFGLLLIVRPRSSFYIRSSFEREREIRTCGSVRCRVSFLAVCQAWRYAARPRYSVNKAMLCQAGVTR